MEFNDDFNLYKLIAKNVISAVPVKQLEKKIFQEFLIKKEDIPKNTEYIITNYDTYVYIHQNL